MAKIKVETSARHVHLTKEDVAVLFGEGHELTKLKDLSQPGQFACEERVTVVGPKRQLERVIVLGPERKATQVELSLTDAIGVGIKAPIRESGNTAGSASCKLVGPAGELEISEGVIIAKRHIHFSDKDAIEHGVTNGQIVKVKIGTERAIVLEEVVCRVNPSYELSMHIDTDESNAANFGFIGEGELIVE